MLISQKKAKRATVLRGFADYFEALSNASEGFLGELGGLVSKCSSGKLGRFTFPEEISGEYEKTGDMALSWIKCVERYFPLLKNDEIARLKGFADAFSGFSKKEFSDNCALAAESFCACAAEAEEECKRTGRLTVALSSLLAALIFIILI